MIKELLGNTDVYLIDQILKDRYLASDTILDAGCGQGRNLRWFYHQKCRLYAIDQSAEAIAHVSEMYPDMADRCLIAPLSKLPISTNFFDHIICNAVLHFARDHAHFDEMMAELVRVVKPGGTLFIRMTTDEGIQHTARAIEGGRYQLKDDTERYLITRSKVADLCKSHKLDLLGPFKTTLVEDWRSMATMLFCKMG